MKAIIVAQQGGPEVLEYKTAPMPHIKENEALVKIEVIGVNFLDIYHRSGVYQMPLPFTPGSEAAGIVEAIGEKVTEVEVGQRVAYAMAVGSYAEYAAVPAWKLVPVPETISSQTAAAMMLQGMTAHYLTTSTYPLKAGETALVHAAAGGVGLLLIQRAKRIGARVIGTVSTEAKAVLAREAGADDIILYTQQDFETEVKKLTGGKGVQVVYDSVGKDTFEKSLGVLVPRGVMVLFGQSSGVVPLFDLNILNKKGSLYISRPSLGHYILSREELLWRTNDLFTWIGKGELKIRIDRTYALAQAAEAHRALEARETTGKVLLIP
jgi:NADPH2:quinone reductase